MSKAGRAQGSQSKGLTKAQARFQQLAKAQSSRLFELNADCNAPWLTNGPTFCFSCFSEQLYIGRGLSTSGIKTTACPKDPSVNPPGPGLFLQSSLLVVCP